MHENQVSHPQLRAGESVTIIDSRAEPSKHPFVYSMNSVPAALE